MPLAASAWPARRVQSPPRRPGPPNDAQLDGQILLPAVTLPAENKLPKTIACSGDRDGRCPLQIIALQSVALSPGSASLFIEFSELK
jgi:hypothetical protein